MYVLQIVSVNAFAQETFWILLNQLRNVKFCMAAHNRLYYIKRGKIKFSSSGQFRDLHCPQDSVSPDNK